MNRMIIYQFARPSAFGLDAIFSPDKPLQGTNVMVCLKPTCLRNTLNFSTISLNLSFDQLTVSNLLTITASCDTPKKCLQKLKNVSFLRKF